MKLYVWENVRCDYSCGIVVIYARNEDQAWLMLKEKNEYAYAELSGEGFYDTPTEKGRISPRVITRPEVFVVNGGS